MLDQYTISTRQTLEDRYNLDKEGYYFAHQPIYGYRTPYASTSSIARYMITKSILNALNKYDFSNFIDVGGAEGYTANIVRELFKVPVHITELSSNACKRAMEIFGIEGTPADIHQLPFSDNAFDAVLCSETIEHITDYQKAVSELLRITNKVLVITVPHESPAIVAANIRNKVPHGHINYFDVNAFNYLKEMGYRIAYEKTLSPLLIVPRVVAEGFKKTGRGLHYKMYNFFTPFFKRISGIRTANFLTDLDTKFTKYSGWYGGITFIIEKNGVKGRKPGKNINAKRFTNIKVPLYKIK